LHETATFTAIEVNLELFMKSSRIGSMIKYHRNESGLSQLQLADIAGVGKTVIFDIEKGKQSIRLDTLLKVCQALNISLDFKSPLMANFEERSNE
jgi:y4mF family transcriptional regulator